MDLRANNRLRLQVLIKLFNLSIADVARVCGVSPSLISLIISGDRYNEEVFLTLENRLPDLIAKKKSSFFDLVGVDVEVVENVRKIA